MNAEVWYGWHAPQGSRIVGTGCAAGSWARDTETTMGAFRPRVREARML